MSSVKPPQSSAKKAKRGGLFDAIMSPSGKKAKAEGPVQGGPEYPQTMSHFLQGIKGDFVEVFETGAKAMAVLQKKAYRLLLEPATEESNSSGKTSQATDDLTASQNRAHLAQSQDALRSRLPSMWTDRDNKENVAGSANVVSSSSSSSGSTTKANASIAAGDLVNLALLSSKPTLHSFNCIDGGVVVIGKRRMILVQPLGKDNIGKVSWSQQLSEIESCTIRELFQGGCRLDLHVKDDRTMTLNMSSAATSAAILQCIQRNRELLSSVGDVESGGAEKQQQPQLPTPKELSSTNVMPQPVEPPQPGPVPSVKSPATQPSSSSSSAIKRKAAESDSPATEVGASASHIDTYRRAIICSSIRSPKPLSPVPFSSHAKAKSPRRFSPVPSPVVQKARIALMSPVVALHSAKSAYTSIAAAATTTTASDSTSAVAPSAAQPASPQTLQLTPGTYTRVDICARQMKHGVGEMGVRGKLASDGLIGDKVDVIIAAAKKVLTEGALLKLVARQQQQVALGTASSTNTSDIAITSSSATILIHNSASPPPSAAVGGPSATGRSALMAMLASRQPRQESVAPIEKVVESADAASSSTTLAAEVVIAEQGRTELPVKNAISADSDDGKKAGGAGGKMVPLCEHPVYAKFFKMLKVGLPREKVRQKMQEEGKDLSYLDKDPQELVPLIEAPGQDPSAPAAPASAGVPFSEHPTYSKYFRMLKVGLPKDAVKAKMQQEGLDPSFLDKDASELVGAEEQGGRSALMAMLASRPRQESVASIELPAALRKFVLMLKHGVPAPAVAAKMQQEGISQQEQDLVLGGANVKIEPPSTPAAACVPCPAPAPAAELPAALIKYQTMIKNGVPAPAVYAKMTMEGVAKEHQALVMGSGADGSIANPSTSAVAVVNSCNSCEATPKLTAFHWEVIGGHTPIGWSTGTASALEGDEFAKLASTFARKDDAKKQAPGTAESNLKEKDVKKSAQKSQPKHIDSTRSMNMSIGLASFRGMQMGVAEIVASIKAMDCQKLGLDGVLRCKEMLPSETEAKTLKLVAQSAYDSLHDAEKLLYQLSTIKNVRGRVTSQVFLLNSVANSETLIQGFETLTMASRQALDSAGLQTSLVAVLAIGNSLNRGTFKGSASGFRLSSLGKLQTTRSTDGSTNLVDYLLTLLTERKESGDAAAAAALEIPETLKGVTRAKQLMLADLLRDSQAFTRDCQLSSRMVSEVVAEQGQAQEHLVAPLREMQSQAELREKLVSVAASSAKTSCEELASYFGESPEAATTCISILADFLASVSASKKKIGEKAKKRERTLHNHKH